ncbi:2-oxo acid dehydrogenase subunit E2 [Streptosporangium sp. NBC_01495]|uniref:dihydrolipoamide acetyltransferase family protein n=1 Tax=Streptosporangium sp. NBC_01495 TaxID=2903899 RepID=UPI002E33DA14|nr:dihydrolipoamide acetyltransferase family protein [Streptosporangium sp. NBC_01495]
MAELLRMPEVATAATTATVSSWPFDEGADFEKDDTIAIVETDKAEVDLPAIVDGRIIKTLVPAGSEVEMGDPIAVLGAPGEEVPDIDALLAEMGVGSAPRAVVSAPVRREVPEQDVAGQKKRSAGGSTSDTPVAPGPARPERVFTSPLARQMARKAGIDVDSLNGTGPGGRIVRRDVAAVIAGQTTAVPRQAPVPAAATGGTGYRDVTHSRMRAAIARRLVASKQEIPHFYLRATCRVDDLLALRDEINENSEIKISVNDLLIKAIAAAHVRIPQANVIWTDEAIRQFDAVDVSVAIATETGLVTPVLRGVDTMSLSTIAKAVRGHVERARSGRLNQSDLEGGSITITNLGMFGVEEFSAIINPPQAAILAIGQARTEPVVVNGLVDVAQVLRVVLSVDHRPIDGALAARWMRVFVELVENPMGILI